MPPVSAGWWQAAPLSLGKYNVLQPTKMKQRSYSWLRLWNLSHCLGTELNECRITVDSFQYTGVK